METASPKGLTPCPTCSRTFNTVALGKHIVICQKMAEKKRKPFDSSRQRREGTELAQYLPKNFGLPSSKQQASQEPSAAEEKFVRSTARASTRGPPKVNESAPATVLSVVSPKSMPSPPKPNAAAASKYERHASVERPRRSQATAPTSSQCPTCHRYFGIKAYDRHVEWCKEKSLQGTMKNLTTANAIAKERLAARIKYRAPIKTKRSLNREKYAGLMDDENDGDEIPNSMTASTASDSYRMHETFKSRRIEEDVLPISCDGSPDSQGNLADAQVEIEKLRAELKNAQLEAALYAEYILEKPADEPRDEQEFALHAEKKMQIVDESTAEPRFSPMAALSRVKQESAFHAEKKMQIFDEPTAEPRVSPMAALSRAKQESAFHAEKKMQILEKPPAEPNPRPMAPLSRAEQESAFHAEKKMQIFEEPTAEPHPRHSARRSLSQAFTNVGAEQFQDCPHAEQESALHEVPTSEPHSRPFVRRSHSQAFINAGQAEQLQDYPRAEAPMPMPQNAGIRPCMARQFTDPNIRYHPMPPIRNQFYVDDVYPLVYQTIPLDIQQQQHMHHQQLQQQQLQEKQQQMQHKQQELQQKQEQLQKQQQMKCFPPIYPPCPLISFGTSKLRKKVKMYRQNSNCANILNPNVPMKAFRMPFSEPKVRPDSVLPLPTEAPIAPPPAERDNCRFEGGGPIVDNLPKETGEKSGLSNSAYDPFLSAKRQLEELCLSSSPPNTGDTHLHSYNGSTLSTPTTPSAILPSKMATSLTLSSTSTSMNTSSQLTPNNTQIRKNPATNTTTTTTSSTPISNFRRTSSLRGPRRSPLLNARPFFAQKRPTIQRGLSDEGPISTNFLKSEEYDEIPVRSVCVNDFAITNSPRVVRRDTSLSNRKAGFKLQLHDSDNLGQNKIPKDISKTDSLAVFLKYERELEKLNQMDSIDAAQRETNGGPLSTQDISANLNSENSQSYHPHTTSSNENPLSSASKIGSPVLFTKELKDKSNNLSKQNSAKSLRLEPETFEDSATAVRSSPCAEYPSSSQNTPKQNLKLAAIGTSDSDGKFRSPQSENVATNHRVRLEPIQQTSEVKRSAVSAQENHNPISKPIGKQPSQLPMLSRQSSRTSGHSDQLQQQQQQQYSPNANTNTMQGNVNTQREATYFYDKEDKENNKTLSSSAEFIDPKLINKCDNLPVKLADLKYVDSDSSAEQGTQTRQDHFSDPYDGYMEPVSQLSKLLPLVNKTNGSSATTPQTRNAQTQSTPKHIINSAIPSTQHPHQQPSKSTVLPRSITDGFSNSGSSNSGRNLLKRKMRLGRNQFLYDASPEALEIDSSCSADDETNPRSSAEYDSQLNNRFEQFIYKQTPHHHLKTPSPPPMPNLPIFDNFDFEEFLSSFENDDEEFPLFRDCREFLRNRPTNKVHSSTPNRPSSNKLHSTPKSPYDSSNYNNQNFFQFPVLNISHQHQHHHHQGHQSNNKTPPHIIESSSRRSIEKPIASRPKESQNVDFQAARSTRRGSFDLNGERAASRSKSRGSQEDFKKREIFISIETEQNDELGRTQLSPNSLRDIVGNSQAVVEVEVDGNDNKFSKISDDDDNETNPTKKSNGEQQLPNVEINNAKNLIQKMSEDNRQMVKREGGRNNNVDGKINAGGDSDEMSSLEGYPVASNGSSRRNAGVAPKMSADSAYGSLSRQRSSELVGCPTIRASSRTRPTTAAAENQMTLQKEQQQLLMRKHYDQEQFMLQKQQNHLRFKNIMLQHGTRMRHLSGSSSSGSDNSLPPLLQQQQHEQMAHQHYQPTAYAMDMINGNHPAIMMGTGQSATSRFCHECGSKFLIENAKFCMDCGVKRLMM